MFNSQIKKLLAEAELIIDNKLDSESNLGDMLDIKPEILDHEIITNPSSYAALAILKEKAIMKERQAKDALAKTKAAVSLQFRINDTPLIKSITQGIKMTADAVEAFTETNELVIEAQEEYRQAQYESGIMQEIVKGLAQKGDMLRTLASNARKERENC